MDLGHRACGTALWSRPTRHCLVTRSVLVRVGLAVAGIAYEHPIAERFAIQGVEDIEAWLDGLRGKRYVPGKGNATGRKTRSSKSEPKSYAAGTIKGYYRVLAQIVTAACARARIPNPCDRFEAPSSGKRRKNVLGVGEVAGVLAHIQANAPNWYAAVLLDVVSGLRWGELQALRWEDIDEVEGG